MHAELLNERDHRAYHDFVESHPCGSVEQSLSWGELQARIPGRPDFRIFVVKAHGKIVGSILVIRQVMGFGKSWLWAPGGPLLPDENGGELWAELHAQVKAYAKETGAVFLRLEPANLEGSELPISGKPVKESYLPRHTLKISLEKSLDDIKTQMKQKGRYNIKRAQKTEVYVQEAPDRNVDGFFEILEETAERDGFGVHSREYYQNFLDHLEDHSHLYLAYHEHDLLGGMIVTHFGDTATYYFGASSDKHRQRMAPYALQWFAIQQAKSAGMKHYDFLGIAPEGDEAHPLAGVTQFKTRFGGKMVQYEGARVNVYRPFWWLVYRVAKCVARRR